MSLHAFENVFLDTFSISEKTMFVEAMIVRYFYTITLIIGIIS